MKQPAIQAALNNLVEAIRTALMAEFVEYSRGGDPEPVQAKRGKKAGKAKKAVAKKAVAKKAATRGKR